MTIAKVGQFTLSDLYRAPAALALSVLVSRNYALRERRLLPDKWYWADEQLLKWGYAMRDTSRG